MRSRERYIFILIIICTHIQTTSSQELPNSFARKYNIFMGLNTSLVNPKNNIDLSSQYDPVFKNTDSIRYQRNIGIIVGIDRVVNLRKSVYLKCGIQYFRLHKEITLFGDSLASNGYLPEYFDSYHFISNNIEIPLSITITKKTILLNAGIKYVFVSFHKSYGFYSNNEVFKSPYSLIINPKWRIEKSFIPFIGISIACPKNWNIPLQFSCNYLFSKKPANVLSWTLNYRI